ncbi:hypothetical protein [Streptomyces sp. NPDC001828]|uniref:hypothetical protein n=1 Tax=Streptomyces sp. NPDC001828 TaxID=3364615 RepID=UPI003673EA5B
MHLTKKAGRGATPASVSMAVIAVMTAALTIARVGVAGDLYSGVALLPFTLVLCLPVLLGLSAALTAFYTLPVVIFSHWTCHRYRIPVSRGGKWVAACSTLAAFLAVAVPWCAAEAYEATWGLEYAGSWFAVMGCLWAVATPAALAAHVTIIRENSGHPVRPIGRIAGWGMLALTTEAAFFLLIS